MIQRRKVGGGLWKETGRGERERERFAEDKKIIKKIQYRYERKKKTVRIEKD